MQSIALPPTSFTTSQFGHPRFYLAPDRLALNYTLPTNARLCNPRDLPPLHPMSSSVPADDPLETPRTIRLPSQGEGTAVSAVPVTAPVVTTTSVPETALASGSSIAATAHSPGFKRHAISAVAEVSRPPFALSVSAPASQVPLGTSEQRASQHSASTFPTPAFGTSPTGTANRALPPKGSRRTKAHVVSACVNCKKKHLGCDSARPCRRCVLSGKEATCVDVVHKKRGRPPLKAEDASLRSYASQTVSVAPSGEPQTPLSRRTHTHRSTGSREIRPMTDLQLPNTPHGTFALRDPTGHPPRWSTGVYPQMVDPSLSMHANMGHRRFSSSGSIPQMTIASPPSYIPLGAGFNPAYGPARTPVGSGRPLSSYANQTLPPATTAATAITTPPQYQQPFGVPISPYAGSPRMMGRLPGGEPPLIARDLREPYHEPSVRLPPIFPPAMPHSRSTPQAHRLSDPYPAAWSPRLREELMQQQSPPQQYYHHHRQGMSSPHGFMEPISPSSQMRHAAIEAGYREPRLLQRSAQVAPMGPNFSTHLPAVRRENEPSTTEAGPDESRPAKRRKMALDDMVND